MVEEVVEEEVVGKPGEEPHVTKAVGWKIVFDKCDIKDLCRNNGTWFYYSINTVSLQTKESNIKRQL